MVLKVPMKKKDAKSAGSYFGPPISYEDLCVMAHLIENNEKMHRIFDNKHEDSIRKVIFNSPATIVFWEDGSKTVVKAVNEPFDPEKGLAMAVCKKFFGNDSKYYNIFKKWIPEELMEEAEMDRMRLALEQYEPKSDQISLDRHDSDVAELYNYRKLMQDGYSAQQEAENGD